MDPRGFTLFELMVVLAIMVILTGLAVPMLFGRSANFAVEKNAHEIADGLARTRSRAIATNRAAAFIINLDERWFRETSDENTVPLQDGVEISFVTARSETIDSSTAGIRFYPDGSSSGGRVELSTGTRHYAVLVDWLTGRVRVKE